MAGVYERPIYPIPPTREFIQRITDSDLIVSPINGSLYMPKPLLNARHAHENCILISSDTVIFVRSYNTVPISLHRTKFSWNSSAYTMTQHLLSTVKNCRPDSLCGKRPIGKRTPRIINDARPAIGTETHTMLSKQFD